MFNFILSFWTKIANIRGGSYNEKINEFLKKIISSIYKANFIKQNTLSIVDSSELGGIYFIEGESKKETKEYYKVGMSGYNLLKRIDSYGTYYPFGINVRGISFTLQLKDIEKYEDYSDLITIINGSYHTQQLYIKKELIEKYKKLIDSYNENIEIDPISIQNHYKNIILYNYFNDTINDSSFNKEKFNKHIFLLLTNSLEIKLQKNIQNIIADSKVFESKIQSRDKYGEFFKVSKDQLLQITLETSKELNQVLIWFPDETLIFGKYGPEFLNKKYKIPKYNIYFGNKKII
jgi:hypothetical protein